MSGNSYDLSVDVMVVVGNDASTISHINWDPRPFSIWHLMV